MKILHTADIHLREYADERWEALKKLIEIGRKEDIEVLVISGDLFDRGVDAENLRDKIREVFSNNGFKICVIPGNHDSDSYKMGKYFGEDVVILTDLNDPFEYGDVKIWGMGFEPVEGEEVLNKLYSLKNNLTADKKNILLYHGELLDAFFSRMDFGDEGEERYMPVKVSYFKDLNIDYVLAGHFHSKFSAFKLENGGYFVYPGSPISITRREVGRRAVNIFQVGKPPQECLLDTPHYEEVVIQLDPFEDKEPVDIVEKAFNNLHPDAMVILRVTGFINGEAIGINEEKLVGQIKKLVLRKCIEDHYEFKDIQEIVEDDLFKRFLKKLEQTDYKQEKKEKMRDMAIKAVMSARL